MNTLKTAPQDSADAKPDESGPLMDTSKMSAGQRAALELTAGAREKAPERNSFAGGLFMGGFDLPTIFTFPEQSAADGGQGDTFLRRLERFLR